MRIPRMLVYRQTSINVYRKSTGHESESGYPRNFRGISIASESSHQQYLAKNPEGYCGIGGCGVRFDSAEIRQGV